jgi:hypothetical protein
MLIPRIDKLHCFHKWQPVSDSLSIRRHSIHPQYPVLFSPTTTHLFRSSNRDHGIFASTCVFFKDSTSNCTNVDTIVGHQYQQIIVDLTEKKHFYISLSGAKHIRYLDMIAKSRTPHRICIWPRNCYSGASNVKPNGLVTELQESASNSIYLCLS